MEPEGRKAERSNLYHIFAMERAAHPMLEERVQEIRKRLQQIIESRPP